MTVATLTSTFADVTGRGLVAGLVGTAAMTVSSTIEAKLNRRGASTAPAEAAATVAGVQVTEHGQQRFNTLVHWAYGTSWGAARGLIRLAGLTGPTATLLHLGAVLGAEQAVLPATGAGGPVWRYGAAAVGTDALHHSVYAVVTGLAYEWLERS